MKTKKLFAAILAATVCVGTMPGCAGSSADTTSKEFQTVSVESVTEYSSIWVYVHKKTRVMYMRVEGLKNGGLTVMLDSDGKPLLYEGELEE